MSKRSPRRRRQIYNSYLWQLCKTSVAELQQLHEKQQGLCAICMSPIDKHGTGVSLSTRACIDHDHKTKKMRGLLCLKCNTGLGMFNDSPILLLTAAEYLKEHGDKSFQVMKGITNE